MLRSLVAFCMALFLFVKTIAAQNCPPPANPQAIYVFPYEAYYSFTLSGATSGWAEIVPQGQPFDNPVTMAIFDSRVYFQSLTPGTTYTWRARSYCTNGGLSDWTQVYTFTTPPPCPPTTAMPFDSDITLTFPAPSNPNISYYNCGALTNGSGYVFTYVAPLPGNYRLTILESNGGAVQMGTRQIESGDYCRESLNCVSANSEAGVFTEFYGVGAGSRLIVGFSAAQGVNAVRKVRLTYTPCPTLPTFALAVDTIRPNSVRLFSAASQTDIEVIPDAETFSGVPDVANVTGFVTFDNLTPGTRYRWRGRNNCGVTAGEWVEGPVFTTSYACDSIPPLRCDSLYPGFLSGVGTQKIFRYRPTYSHELLVTYQFSDDPQYAMTLAVRDSALADCFDPNWTVNAWPTYLCCRNDTATLHLGYLEAGKTYYLYADKYVQDAMPGRIKWHCASACPAPGNLTSTVTGTDAATLHWHNNEATAQWQMELQTDPFAFTGTPQFGGTGDMFTATNLLADTLYYWRVRNICAGNGAGEWSDMRSFHTPVNCADAPVVTCGVPVQAMNFESYSSLDMCPGDGAGTERFYRFTPDFSGEYLLQSFESQSVGRAIKVWTPDCAANTGWTCIENSSPTSSMGVLTGGQTYLIMLDFPNYADYPDLNISFVILCPTACSEPTDLSADLTSGSVQLNWTGQPNQVGWEIEIQPVGTSFTGAPNYFSNQNSLVLSTLATSTPYQWRVRGVCGALGTSYWTTGANFLTLPNCNAYPTLGCEQEITLHFQEGQGYWSSLPACTDGMFGQEQILQFTTDGPTRYIVLPGQSSYFGFYLKKAGSSACEDVNDWQCVGNNLNSGFIELNNLTPGATYYLLCKKQWYSPADSLRLSFHCSFSCPVPDDPKMTILGFPGPSYAINVQWDGANGPWVYQVGLHKPDGSELLHNEPNWSSGGFSLLDWFPVNTSDIYGWRVRRICNNGDTSAWTPYTRFRLPLCSGAIDLPCNDTLIITNATADRYHYFDICSNESRIGQQHIYRLPQQPAGTFSLKIDFNNGLPVPWAVSQDLGSSCSPANWINCGTLTGDTLLNLGTLGNGLHLVQLATSDTLAFAPRIEVFCPCPPPPQGKGILYGNGDAVLDWFETYNSSGREVEIVPIGTSFSGTPNYFTDSIVLVVNGLDPTLSYQFRVRNRCGDTGFSEWSDIFPVTLLVDCANTPALICSETLQLEFTSGIGLVNYQVCGAPTYGDEAFFQMTPEFSGIYSMEVLGTPIPGAVLYLGLLSSCEHPDSEVSCLGNGGGIGIYNLGYLEAGQTYFFVADQSGFVAGTYTMALNCSLANDNPSILLGEPNSLYSISVGDTCHLFSNLGATSNSPDPDPSQAPGNWYDGPEHSVWFQFVAPPGGTVQITAASDSSQPFDPQVALLTFDTLAMTGQSFVLLATGEDNAGLHPADAILIYTGLIPGQVYYILVDGANGSSGRFCLTIRDEPDMWLNPGVCQNFVQSSTGFTGAEVWRNLYAGGSEHVTGALLGAIRTVDDLGAITISTEILPDAPVLPNGQKILPRYFNIEPEFQPVHPITLRLFFTAADLAAFNITPPMSSVTPVELGLTHYDGNEEDCDPTNNALVGGLSVSTAQATLVGENGIFYLEATFDSFSEFGAALAPTIGVPVEPNERFAVSVSPNPFTEDLTLEIQSKVAARLNFQMLDMLAGSIRSGSLAVQSGKNLEVLEFGDVAPGVYQLVLYNGGMVIGRVKVVKM